MSKIPILVVEPDPWLAIAIESMLGDLQPRPEMFAVADVEELYGYAKSGAVVVAGPSCRPAAAIAELQAFHDAFPSARIVLAFDKRPGANMAEVVRVGAESLVDPRDEEALSESIRRSLVLADATAPTTLVVASDGGLDAPPEGRVFTVCSATGGCGKTFYASNAAYMLSKYTRGKVALVDLDLQFGEVVTAMRVRFKHTIADAIEIDSDDELEAYIPEMMVAHESGVWILPAPADPAQADQIRPQDITRIIRALQNHYDYIIVDNPTGLGDQTLAAMDLSEHLFILAALDLSSVRNLRLFLQTIDRLQIPDDNLSLILNKEQSGVGIDASQVEKLFPAGFRSTIPFSKDVPKSMNQGIPVLASVPESPLGIEIVEGLMDFLNPADRATAKADLDSFGTTGFFAKLFKKKKESPDVPGDDAEKLRMVTGDGDRS